MRAVSMRWLLPGLLWLMGLVSVLPAEEPYLDFVAGLRDRGYHDFAEQYLKDLEQNPKVPQEIRERIPYELGVTLRDSAQSMLIPEEQRVVLDEAQAAFERFARESPNHPLAGRANSERARMLLEKAKVDIWDSQGESDDGARRKLQESARDLIGKARKVFETAVEQHQKNFESFPAFIPEEEQDRRRQRRAAQEEYLQAQLDLAETIYWEAQAHDVGAEARKQLLTDAMLKFEQIHTENRLYTAGIVARLWQGKCMEEMGSIGEALGLYGEILKHDGTSPTMLQLKAKARQFQLICYNREEEQEYALVNRLASEWLRDEKNRRLKYTEVGKAIEWEQAQALEKLGQDRTVPENDRISYLNQAKGLARDLSRASGPLKAPAAAMMARLTQLLGQDGQDPTDFSSAYGRAMELFERAQEISDKIRAAADAERTEEALEHMQARKNLAEEMTRLLKIALTYADDTTEETLQRQAELLLAVGHSYAEEYLDATVVSEYLLRNRGDAPPDTLRLAGEIALQSLFNAYQAADEGDREFEKQQILSLTELLSTRWPGTKLASSAYMAAAPILWEGGDYLQAAETWLKVPGDSDDFSHSRLKAGAAYFEQYAQASRLEELEQPGVEQLEEWLTLAEKYLQEGVTAESARTSMDTANPGLIQGKVALAQIRNLRGVYTTTGETAGAIELLTAGPNSPVEVVEVPAGEERPKDPANIRSPQFASIVYMHLLRAYIGVKNLEEARNARAKLESVGGTDAAALTETFVAFGRQLQEELEQLQSAGEVERLADVRSGFETFLEDLYNREESQQTFSSLLWIAETYASLGESLEQDPAASTAYFERSANAYERILDRAESDPAFVGTPANETAVRVRMLEGRMRQRDYEAAEKVLLEVLKESPNAPNVQLTGARLYEQWGDHGVPEKYDIARNGFKEPVALWGWGSLANKMRNVPNRPELREIYFEATDHYARSYLKSAELASGDEQKKMLEGGRRVLETFARTTRDVPETVWKNLNATYESILQLQGQPVVALQEVSGPVIADGGGGGGPSSAAARIPTQAQAAQTPEPEAPSQVGNIIMMVGLLIVAVVSVGGIFWFTTQQSKKKRAAALAAIAAAEPRKKRKASPARPSASPSE